MTTASQRRATRNYRRRLVGRGLIRFEVLGLAGDRPLLRALARRLAAGDVDAARLREELIRGLSARERAAGEATAR